MLRRWTLVCLVCLPGINLAQSAATKYIEAYKQEAVDKMNKYGVPASIVLGVAMHESGSGTSKVSKFLNNHFGMKGRSGPKKIKSSYKGYDSVSHSYEDFISLLKNRGQFSKLFGKYSDHDYRNWAKGIQKGGYASSRTWSSQVMAIIQKYKLYELDNRPAGDTVLADPVEESAPAAADGPKQRNIYRVKRGDTLLALAKRFGTSVKTIRSRNGLKSANLQIGQRLML